MPLVAKVSICNSCGEHWDMLLSTEWESNSIKHPMCWDAKYRNTTLQAQKLIVSYQEIKSGDLEIEWRYGAE